MDEITTRWDASILNKLIGLAFKTNYNITTANLRNLQQLLNKSNFTHYQTKGVIIKRVNFLKKALKAKFLTFIITTVRDSIKKLLLKKILRK